MTITDTRPAHQILDTHTHHGGPGTNFLGGNNDLGPQIGSAAEGTPTPDPGHSRCEHQNLCAGVGHTLGGAV